MSTKNLARTVIEGGRCNHYKEEVTDFIRSERAASRAFLRVAENDVEAADALPAPKRKPSRPCFADKITPVQGFLDSRVGKPWNKTFTLICEKFDRRTTPGRHVTNDHMLNQIAMNGEHLLAKNKWFSNYYRYFVDAQGILRKVKKEKRTYAPVAVRPTFTVPQILNWLDKRKIGRMGARLVWFVPSRDAETVRILFQRYSAGRFYPALEGSLSYVEVDVFGDIVYDEPSISTPRSTQQRTMRLSTVPYVQTSVLSPEDEAFLLSLPEAMQRSLLSHSPRSGGYGRVFRS